jgi:hypothetical protein
LEHAESLRLVPAIEICGREIELLVALINALEASGFARRKQESGDRPNMVFVSCI